MSGGVASLDPSAIPPPTAEPRDPLDATHLGPEVVRRYLRRHGLDARRSLSQNHLVDGDALRAILGEAAPTPGRRVLEIGPGIGILTGELLRGGAAVTAVEVDPRLAAHLRDRFAPALARGQEEARMEAPGPAAGGGGAPEEQGASVPGSLRLVEGDFLDLEVGDLVWPPYDVAANLPYHITSPVLHRLLGAPVPPERFVLMLQREVAERIAAPPGGMSYLSAFVQYHADVRLVRVVGAESFVPAPSVDSAVLAGVTRPRRLGDADEDRLWRLVQAGFRERRKMVLNVLSRQLPDVGKARIAAALDRAGIAPDRRPQTLSVEEWLALAAALDRAGEEPS